MRKVLAYTVREVVPYINWIYYFHAWGMEPRFTTITDIHDCPACRASWIASFPTEERAKAREAMKLYDEAKALLHQWANESICHAIILLAKAYSENDDIIINDEVRIPFLRQQHVGNHGYTLCLSDFIRGSTPSSTERDTKDIANTIGIFATCVSQPDGSQNLTFDFQLATLTDRLAEATAEKVHEEVRKYYWGYAKEEQLTMRELHEERFQGIRPAICYPSLPDQSINFLINDLLYLSDIGITLSEHGAMIPHCSVSGFMFAHPEAHYFAIGDITEEQLKDYSVRRGLDVEVLRNFLASNLKNKV